MHYIPSHLICTYVTLSVWPCLHVFFHLFVYDTMYIVTRLSAARIILDNYYYYYYYYYNMIILTHFTYYVANF